MREDDAPSFARQKTCTIANWPGAMRGSVGSCRICSVPFVSMQHLPGQSVLEALNYPLDAARFRGLCKCYFAAAKAQSYMRRKDLWSLMKQSDLIISLAVLAPLFG